jgi:hypothetical protein
MVDVPTVVSWLAAETAPATGTSKNMVFNIQSEAARGPLRTPNKKRRRRLVHGAKVGR